jgi:hypothetical protein
MGDIIIATYGHDHKHKQFIKYWREFRERYPEAKNTPELARVEFYNLRYDPSDRELVKHEINKLARPDLNKFFFLKRDGKLGKLFLKLFNFFTERNFKPYEPIKENKDFVFTEELGHMGIMPLFEKEDIYNWNENEP